MITSSIQSLTTEINCINRSSRRSESFVRIKRLLLSADGQSALKRKRQKKPRNPLIPPPPAVSLPLASLPAASPQENPAAAASLPPLLANPPARNRQRHLSPNHQ